MTIRAVLIGLLLGLVIATFGYVNDWVLYLSYVAGDLMPVSVYGLLVLGLVLVNPALRALGRRHLKGAEWTVIWCLMLVACVIPGPGLLWGFHNAIVMPVAEQREHPGWQATEDRPDLLSYVPERMLAAEHLPGREQEDVVIRGFLQGLGDPDKMMPVSRVPWRAWVGPYSFYIPLIVLGFIASICVAVIIHRQWAYREHLRYPMAEVTNMLIGEDPSQAFGSVFRQKLFWLGFALAGGILLINGLNAYYPAFVNVPLHADLTPIAQACPRITKIEHYLNLLQPRLFFALVGMAFLISSEVSFSLGISHIAYALLFSVLLSRGVDMANDHMSGGVPRYQIFGSYLGGGLVIVYAGRKFYWAVLKRALGGQSGEAVERRAIWACRLLMASGVAMILLLRVLVGLDLFLSALFVMIVGLMFLVLTRINVETGVLFIQPWWQPVAVLTGLFGVRALGPRAIITLGLLSLVLTIDPRVCLMPLVSNAFKVADRQRVRTTALSGWVMVMLVLGLAVAVPFVLYVQYDIGGAALYGWANTATRMPFETLKRDVDDLVACDALDSAGKADGWGGLERIKQIEPSRVFLWSAGAGVALILICTAGRLRWPWWPIHPVMFMVWGTNVSRWFGPSFMAGWLAKVIITRFGGAAGYRKARSFFIGIIAGEVVAGVGWMIVGALYYAYYRVAGPSFRVHW